MQTNLPPQFTPLGNDAIIGALNTQGVAVGDVDDPSFQPAPSAANKAPRPVVPPVDVFNMLTENNTHPTPDTATATTVGAEDADWDRRRRQVCAMMVESRMKRSNLALDMCRLHTKYKTATGKELFPQAKFDAYTGFIDRCAADGDKVTVEDVQHHLAVLPQAIRDQITADVTATGEDEDEDEHMDEDEDGVQDA